MYVTKPLTAAGNLETIDFPGHWVGENRVVALGQ